VRSLAERKALVARLPWVKVLPSSAPETRCEGIKWGKVALRDIYARGGQPARGIQEKAKCKRRGWYRFTALRSRGAAGQGTATSGVYCYDHLTMQIGDHEREHDRLRRWLEQNEPSWL
jgi:hypothetical protein